MSDPVLIALIVGLPPTIIALGGLISSIMNRQRAIKVEEKLDVVHGQINGMKDQLVAATKVEGQAVGEAIGREKATAEGQARVSEAERVEDRATDKLTDKKQS